MLIINDDGSSYLSSFKWMYFIAFTVFYCLIVTRIYSLYCRNKMRLLLLNGSLLLLQSVNKILLRNMRLLVYVLFNFLIVYGSVLFAYELRTRERVCRLLLIVVHYDVVWKRGCWLPLVFLLYCL